MLIWSADESNGLGAFLSPGATNVKTYLHRRSLASLSTRLAGKRSFANYPGDQIAQRCSCGNIGCSEFLRWLILTVCPECLVAELSGAGSVPTG